MIPKFLHGVLGRRRDPQPQREIKARAQIVAYARVAYETFAASKSIPTQWDALAEADKDAWLRVAYEIAQRTADDLQRALDSEVI